MKNSRRDAESRSAHKYNGISGQIVDAAFLMKDGIQQIVDHFSAPLRLCEG